MVSTSPRPKVHSTPDRRSGGNENSTVGTNLKDESSMKLSMVSIEKGGLILVAAEGNITATDFDVAGTNPLQTLLGATWSSNRVILNMEKTAYIDSSAIGWLISTRKSFADAGGAIAIYNVQQAVRQLMDMLKISRVLPIADDEAAARKLVDGGAK